LRAGAKGKQRTVAEILGNPAPGSLLDSVMKLAMAAGSAFASLARHFPDAYLISYCTRSMCPCKFCWQETRFTTLYGDSTGYCVSRRHGASVMAGSDAYVAVRGRK